MSKSEQVCVSEQECMNNKKNEQVSMFEQGCEQVSNLVSIIVYEQVQEVVSKHKCEQVSKSEQVRIIV